MTNTRYTQRVCPFMRTLYEAYTLLLNSRSLTTAQMRLRDLAERTARAAASLPPLAHAEGGEKDKLP